MITKNIHSNHSERNGYWNFIIANKSSINLKISLIDVIRDEK